MTTASSEPQYIYRLPPCPAYDVAGTEQWLTEMSERGYDLAPDGFFLGFAAFEKREASPARYRLEAVPPAKGMFDDGIEPDTEAVELAEHYGWKYVARRGEFYIYRTVRQDARELHTDPCVRAIAMKGIRSRQYAAIWEMLFWGILYPLLYHHGRWFLTPLLRVVILGTPLFVFSLVMITWLFTRTIVRAVSLERLRKRLLHGESLHSPHDQENLHRHACRHRVGTIVRVILVTVWLLLLLTHTLNGLSKIHEVPLNDYLADGHDIPFATMQQIAQTQGDVDTYRQTVIGYGNTVLAWHDPLAPVNIDFSEIAEITLADGRIIEGALYVDYHETATPWIAAQIAREYHRVARQDKNYRALPVSFPEMAFAVAYQDEFYWQTVILQQGNRVIHASFHPYSDTIDIPLACWTATLAECLT